MAVGGALIAVGASVVLLVMAVGGALIAVGAAVVLPAVAVCKLGLLSFSSVGLVAGSAAAAIPYGGAIASRSAFALAQAAAMGRMAVGLAADIVATEIAAAAYAVIAGIGFLQNAANDELDVAAGEDNANH
ncbi:hypothetical protein FRB94_008672 [Tulasnella sp. JGI-2019a]|nr:hypothetical protein FRB94_008672 [Tulasnella sp. JGI-2019a]